MSKHFKVEIRSKPPEVITVRDTDTPEAWFRDYVTSSRHKTVHLNSTAYLKTDILSVKEFKLRKGSTSMRGI